ncbi:uncharacterized protein LOC126092234 isoform X1 [Schistocerca cancellata]|uniref:uncharacterized protein LOC126092234 isoform X1 n=1 Tax=Schistocerca cancellata TaxID=274614 RepID=UPI0021181D33|nr:uncharacterized protein LOC126092234 isoform X1 [Schistocerca cancellata]
MELTNEKYKFAIVKFPEEDDALGIIALCWIQNDGTTCLYPPVTTDSKRNKLLREEALPLQSWSSHKISLMKKYATYNDAREHLRKAEETSNLESEEEIGVKRKRKAKDITLPGEESSDEDYMPKKKCKTNRVTVHPYPSLDSFTASFSSSPSTGMEAREMWSSIPPNSLTPRPSSFSNAKIPPAPLASAHCPRKEKSAPLGKFLCYFSVK